MDKDTIDSLTSFRKEIQLKELLVDGAVWNYVAVGEGEEGILFLHGMAGAYDIWWQQILMLKDKYKIVSVSYPPLDSLAEMGHGLIKILEEEKIGKINIVGSSLGGYLTQYMVATYPDNIKKAVFANTFPPNDIIAEKNKGIGKALPFLPEWVVFRVLRQSTEKNIYPAAGHSELVRAYMLEQSYGMMSKAQFVARFHCVIDGFSPADNKSLGIPVLIIEADNDPLVEKPLREMLKQTYPDAEVKTLHAVGHFPYLNKPGLYTQILKEFLSK